MSEPVKRLYTLYSPTISNLSISNKCIVLDLDHTLVATQENIKSLQDLNILSDPKLINIRNRVYHINVENYEKPGIGTNHSYWGITRPHVKEFLIFCFSYFKIVAVWSAGKPDYVEKIVDYLFKDISPPHIVLTYNDILIDSSGNVNKPLTTIFQYNNHMSHFNTFALDDISSTFSLNPLNGILIPKYSPSLNLNSFASDDPSLLQLKSWLLLPEVIASNDVRSLDTSKIFTTSLLTYQKFIRSYKFK